MLEQYYPCSVVKTWIAKIHPALSLAFIIVVTPWSILQVGSNVSSSLTISIPEQHQNHSLTYGMWNMTYDIFSIVSVDCLRSKPILKKFSQGDHFCHHGKGKYLNVDNYDHNGISRLMIFAPVNSNLWLLGWWFLLNFVHISHFCAHALKLGCNVK